MRLKILGKFWLLRHVPYLGNHDGFCDAPDTKGKEIRICSGLRGQEYTETLIHEMLHAAQWHLKEEAVTEMAACIARALHKPEILERVNGA